MIKLDLIKRFFSQGLKLQSIVDVLCMGFLISFNLVWLWPFLREVGNAGSLSAPVIPAFALILSRVLPINECQVAAYVVLFGQLLGVVAFYLFLKELTGRSLPGLMVSFFYSLPVKLLALDRLRFAWVHGDGAHIAALGLFPFVCYFLLTFLKRGRITYGFVSSLGIALVGLVNAFALFNLLLFLLVIFFSELILGQTKVKTARFLVILLFAWGFLSFWYTPGTIWELINSGQGRLIISLFGRLLPLSFFVGPILLVFAYLIFESRESLQPIALALGFLVIYLFLNLVEYLAYADIERYVLLPRRFLPELGLSIALVLGIAATISLDALGALSKFGKLILPKDEMAGEEKRGVSFLFLILIWLVGMAFVYFFLPTELILADIRMVKSTGPCVGDFWLTHGQLCLRNCTNWLDNCVGFGMTAMSFVFMFVLVFLGAKRGLT
ncbi:hypothetical protein KJ596_02840 [Patescibacteria group bacterium]|nr:hypothetical protein [Patescibacteria group bacterium]